MQTSYSPWREAINDSEEYSAQRCLVGGVDPEYHSSHTHQEVQEQSKRIGVRAAKKAERLKGAQGILDAEGAATFRQLAARANDLALDRPDISFATKELCRCFASPTTDARDALKRLVRYLVQAPRMVWEFFHQ